MKSFVLLFWRICIFSSGPETVPANNTFTILIIAINALLNIVVQMLLGDPQVTFLKATTLAVVSLAGTGALIWFVMAIMSLTHRVQQTVTAIFGVEIIMTTITSLAYAATQTVTTNAPVFVITLLTLWSLAIYGFIFHRAMNMHIGFGIAMALFVVIFSVAITQTAITQ